MIDNKESIRLNRCEIGNGHMIRIMLRLIILNLYFVFLFFCFIYIYICSLDQSIVEGRMPDRNGASFCFSKIGLDWRGKKRGKRLVCRKRKQI